MYRAPGIGLAAPQVGQSLRVITIDLMPDEKPTPLTLINPEILALSQEQATREEGCLSLPGIFDKVPRASKIRVRALGRDGKPFEIEAEGLAAVCIQHEIDHLDGILAIDRVVDTKTICTREEFEKRYREASPYAVAQATIKN